MHQQVWGSACDARIMFRANGVARRLCFGAVSVGSGFWLSEVEEGKARKGSKKSVRARESCRASSVDREACVSWGGECER